ncbi:MAG: peptidylprolyl isomerase [Clostridia bacterium]|nr:peptidylprolyl isomerase [Clostridia bacterium]MBQ7339148.1 peptidylprolyl isomerase [Clostridia bacterium]
MLALSMAACASGSAPAHADLDFTAVDPAAVTESDAVTDYVKITVVHYGDIILRLYPEVAPETVANFQSLVAESFYDGLTFHRVVKNFVIQTGDPDANGEGGSDQNIYGEFRLNGFENNLKHIRGVISMARRGDDMNSASSQFFICHKSNTNTSLLNGSYAGFGYVVSGMDVVDKIAGVAVNADDKPLTDVVIERACFVTVN